LTGRQANVLCDMGRYDESIVLHRDALAKLRALKGDADGEVARAQLDLGSTLRKAQRPQEAEPELRAARETQRALYGPDHIAVAPTEGMLALALIDLRRYDEAEELAQHASKVADAIAPEGDAAQFAAFVLASALMGHGKLAEALEVHQRILRTLEQ